MLIAQLAYNSTKLVIIKYLLYYVNYRYKLTAYRDLKDIKSIIVGVDNKACLMQKLHKELSKNIAYRNFILARATNKQRIKGLTFKKEDKVFLL